VLNVLIYFYRWWIRFNFFQPFVGVFRKSSQKWMLKWQNLGPSSSMLKRLVFVLFNTWDTFCKPVFRIREIFGRIRILGTVNETNWPWFDFDSNSGYDPLVFVRLKLGLGRWVTFLRNQCLVPTGYPNPEHCANTVSQWFGLTNLVQMY
jgi:hypothetical protein